MFVAGRARLEYDIFGRVSRPRMIGLIMLPALAPVLVFAPPQAAVLAATLVLAGVALADAIQRHARQS